MCDVVITLFIKKQQQSGSMVMYFLQLGYLLGGNALQEGVAVVSPREYV